MASGNSTATETVTEAGFDMPSREMSAPPGPSLDMPSGVMSGEEVGAFSPATGDMPRGGMEEPAGGAFAGLTAGIEAAALADMPSGEMGGIAAAATGEPTIEISGSWTLLLTSSIFRNEGSR